jgi:hypothetical protein
MKLKIHFRKDPPPVLDLKPFSKSFRYTDQLRKKTTWDYQTGRGLLIMAEVISCLSVPSTHLLIFDPDRICNGEKTPNLVLDL